MKRSASEAELASEREESSEATQRGLGLDHGNVGEGCIQAASVAGPQSTQAIVRGLISAVAVQPMQADLGLESHGFQEQPNVEETGGIAGQMAQANLRLQSHISQEQTNVEERFSRANTDQPTQTALPSLLNLEGIIMDDVHDLLHPSVEECTILEEIVQIATGQVDASYQEPAAGINDRIGLQAPPSDMHNLRNGQGEASQQEDEEAGINNGIMPQAPNAGLVELISGEEETGVQARTRSQQLQNRLPQQGTAKRRILLQVPLGQASCSSARRRMGKEGHTKEPLSADSLISCVTKSDYSDVVQQTAARDVFGSLSTSLLHLPLFLRDACILHASAEVGNEMQEMNFGSKDGVNCQQSMTSHQNNTRAFLQQRMVSSSSIKEAKVTKAHHELTQAVSGQECRKPCVRCSSSRLAVCLLWIATLALILLCLGRSFCKLTRAGFTSSV